MDRTWTEVSADFDAWCRTDITTEALIDSLVDGTHYLTEQLDELQHTADLRLAVIGQLVAQAEMSRQRYDAALLRCAELTDDLRTWRVIAFMVVCVALATWLRFGIGVGQ